MKEANQPPVAPAIAAPPAKAAGRPTVAALEMQWNALLGQQELLREEIKRGEEYLARARAALAECGALLEEWPTYERRCGSDCLPHLTETVLANRRVERFLNRWLHRRQCQLNAVQEAIDGFSQTYDVSHFSENGGLRMEGSESRLL